MNRHRQFMPARLAGPWVRGDSLTRFDVLESRLRDAGAYGIREPFDRPPRTLRGVSAAYVRAEICMDKTCPMHVPKQRRARCNSKAVQ